MARANACLRLKHMKIKQYLLSMSGILLGAMLAAADYHVNFLVVLALALTVISLISFNSLIPGIVCAVATAWLSYGSVFSLESLILLLLGYFVYRLVKNHSPEQGLFRNGIVVTLTSIFQYGFLPVYGVYFVCVHSFGSWLLLIPSFASGALCLAGVNASYVQNRTTRIFHTIWTTLAFAAMTVFGLVRIFDPWHYLYVLMLPVFICLLVSVWTKPETKDYELKFSVATFLFALLSGLGYMIYLF